MQQQPRARNPLLEDPFFRRFFEGPDAPLAPPNVPRQSIGSGVIIDGDEGLVVTNHHVVQGADSIVVTLSDRREFNATLVGSDAGTDVALLRVMTDDAAFAEIPIGDSSGLAVGDYVVAIGNPFGLGQTATAGIVSALGRSGVNIESYEDFIQTDASINPGNSGGALIDINGQLLGVNTAILSGTGGNIGIGFAIPSNMVSEVVEQLLEHGNVQRGRIGIAIQDVTPGLSQALELTTDRGALVTQVEPGSPAEQAGIQPGDVIVAIDGNPIDSSADLRNTVGLVRAGESVEVAAIRDGERRSVRATVAPETGCRRDSRSRRGSRIGLATGGRDDHGDADRSPVVRPRAGTVGQRRRSRIPGGALRRATRRHHHGRQPRADYFRRGSDCRVESRQAAHCVAGATRRALPVLARALSVARELQPCAARFEPPQSTQLERTRHG